MNRDIDSADWSEVEEGHNWYQLWILFIIGMIILIKTIWR